MFDVLVFFATTLLGIVIGFYLSALVGKQFRYLGLALMHPLRLARGVWLCPQCLGSGAHSGDVCWFCLHDYLADHTPIGNVGPRLAFKLWDWKHWRVKGGYYSVPNWTPPDSH